MSADWIMSASADICVSPNINLSSEKTRSAAAELGVNEPTAERAADRAAPMGCSQSESEGNLSKICLSNAKFA